MAEEKNREKNQKNNQNNNQDNKKVEEEKHRDERIEQIGQITLDENEQKQNIHLLSIIGEIEGHDNLSNNSKTTKY